MPRIRTVKPETWTDEKVVRLRPLARLLFIGTWNFADDEGRMEYSPLSLKLRVLPMDKIEIEELVKELEAVNLVQVYQVEGKPYLQVTNFSKHQKIDKRLKSRYPAPPINPESPRLSPNHPTGMEWNGKESKGKKQAPSAAIAPVDERKALIREAIKKGYAWKNENRECPWGPAEEVILGKVLGDVPKSYTAEFFVECVRNKFKSDEGHGSRPREWLRFILSYADSPKDRFGKPKTLGESGNGRKAQVSQDEQRRDFEQLMAESADGESGSQAAVPKQHLLANTRAKAAGVGGLVSISSADREDEIH